MKRVLLLIVLAGCGGAGPSLPPELGTEYADPRFDASAPPPEAGDPPVTGEASIDPPGDPPPEAGTDSGRIFGYVPPPREAGTVDAGAGDPPAEASVDPPAPEASAPVPEASVPEASVTPVEASTVCTKAYLNQGDSPVAHLCMQDSDCCSGSVCMAEGANYGYCVLLCPNGQQDCGDHGALVVCGPERTFTSAVVQACSPPV